MEQRLLRLFVAGKLSDSSFASNAMIAPLTICATSGPYKYILCEVILVPWRKKRYDNSRADSRRCICANLFRNSSAVCYQLRMLSFLSLDVIFHCCFSFKIHSNLNLALGDFQRRRYVTKLNNSLFISYDNKLMISNGQM